MQFGKIAAAGYKCNLRVANKDLGLYNERTLKKCAIPKNLLLFETRTHIEAYY